MTADSHVPPKAMPRHPPDAQVDALLEVAKAINRFTDAYLYCNQPEEGEEGFTGQSLSDTPGRGVR